MLETSEVSKKIGNLGGLMRTERRAATARERTKLVIDDFPLSPRSQI